MTTDERVLWNKLQSLSADLDARENQLRELRTEMAQKKAEIDRLAAQVATWDRAYPTHQAPDPVRQEYNAAVERHNALAEEYNAQREHEAALYREYTARFDEYEHLRIEFEDRYVSRVERAYRLLLVAQRNLRVTLLIVVLALVMAVILRLRKRRGESSPPGSGATAA